MLQVRPHAQPVGPLKIACTNDEYLILSKKIISLWRLQIAQHIAATHTNMIRLSLSSKFESQFTRIWEIDLVHGDSQRGNV